MSAVRFVEQFAVLPAVQAGSGSNSPLIGQ
jgi:hypothetical protein